MPTPAASNPAPSTVVPDAAIPAAAQTAQAAAPVTTATAPAGSATGAGAVADTASQGGFLDSLQSGPFGDFAEMLAIFFLVLGLVCVCLWLVRRIGGKYLPANTPHMALEGRLSIGPKRWIMLVRVDSKRLVLGLTDQHIVKLAELPDDSLPDLAGVPAGGAPASSGSCATAQNKNGGKDQLLDFSALLDEEGRKK